MRIGPKKAGFQNSAIKLRTNQTLKHAMIVLQNSVIAPYITHVYLYGSCARQEQRYDSDVDLMVELADESGIEKYRDDIIRLRGNLSPLSLDLPAVDLHIVIGKQWKNNTSLYYKNIQKEGIEVWDTAQVRI